MTSLQRSTERACINYITLQLCSSLDALNARRHASLAGPGEVWSPLFSFHSSSGTDKDSDKEDVRGLLGESEWSLA